MEPLRIGTLGAAKITPGALTKPAREVPEVEVVAVAARDRARAERFAAEARDPDGLRHLRGTPRRPRGRRGVQPVAQRAARALDARRARCGQACAVREAVHRERRRGGEGRRGGGGVRARGDGGLSLPLPPTHRAGARDPARRRARVAAAHRHPHVLPAAVPARHPVPARSRGRCDDGRRLLRDPPSPDAGRRRTDRDGCASQMQLARRRPLVAGGAALLRRAHGLRRERARCLLG